MSDRDEDASRRLLLGEFGRAHGLAGEVRLKSHTADPLAIATYGPLATDAGRQVVLGRLRPAPGSAPGLLIARVEGVATRAEAEALARLKLYVPRERLPPPDEDEFYLADLIGLRAESGDGQAVGRIIALHDFGAGDILEVAPADGGASLMLAFTKAVVRAVDLAGGRVVVRTDDPGGDESGRAAP